MWCKDSPKWKCSSVGRASDRHAADAGSIPQCGKGFFLPESTFSALSYGVRTPPCVIACIYICAHVKDPVVHVRVRWIMETLKHPACTVGWAARLWRSWLSLGKESFLWEKSQRNNTVVKRNLKKKKKDVSIPASSRTVFTAA